MFSHKSLWALATCTIVVLCGAGCSDSASAPKVVDLAPPAVPNDLVAVFTSNVVKVSWSPNIEDADFVGFRLTRTLGSSEMVLIDTPTNITQYLDGQVSDHSVYQYRVTAVDNSGNESAYASVSVETTPPDARHPEIH